MNYRTPSRPAHAYTLVEVLIVVTILGVVSAVVVPHMLTAGSMGVQAAARAVVSDLLFAQNDAVAAQAPRTVVFLPAEERYELHDENDAMLSAAWISGKAQNYAVDFAADTRFQGVTIKSATFGNDAAVTFDDLGSPDSGGEVVIEFNDQSYAIRVAAFTGRVTVTKLSG